MKTYLKDVIAMVMNKLKVPSWRLDLRGSEKEIWITSTESPRGFGCRIVSLGDGLGKIQLRLIITGKVYAPHDLVIHPEQPPDWMRAQPVVLGRLRPSMNGTIPYRTQELNTVYQNIRKHLLRCGQAYLSPGGLGMGRACKTCPYQLHCVHLEEDIRALEARTP